jgi:hypothetical protein
VVVTNQNCIHKDTKSRLNSVNACYISVQNPLTYCLLFRNPKIKKCKTIILHFVLYGCETWSAISRKQDRLNVFNKKLVNRIFEPKRKEEMCT